MKDVMGLIFTGENDIHLGELTSLRAVAALPIAGRYRVIDFQLSSMVHSGIKNVGVITQKNYSSLMDHIGSGREWDLHGKQGLVMLPPFLTRENMGVYSGLLDALKSNCTYLRLSRQEYIVLTNSHTIYNMDYTDALKYHIEKGADVTVLYAHGAKAVGTEGENDTFLSVDEDGKVTGMEIGSSVPTRDCASLKVYITKRELLRQLVEQNYVSGWDDPRMPTLCGLRRRGYTSHSIRDFCERIGVAKSANTVEYALLEHCLREDLNDTAERTMAVLRPVKLVITNYPEDKTETFEVENNPVHPEQGTHPVTFSREVWIEAEDFLAEPIPKYKRLYPNGPECRLKGAYLITCTGCKQAADGSIEEIYATYDPNSRGGDPADGRKVKGATIHWVDSKTAVDAEVRLYGNLFSDAQPDGPDKNFLDCLNPDSLQVLTGCKVEAALVEEAKKYDAEGEGRMAHTAPGFQFMRVGYFCMDSRDCRADHLVFNRSVLLKDSFKPGK